MLRRVCILVLVVAAGCKSSQVKDGYAVALTIVADSTISDAALASAATLDLEVTGAETFSDKTLSASGKFAGETRSAGLRYRPQAKSGSITMSVTLSDGAGTLLAAGKLEGITLGGGTQLRTLTLSQASAVCGNGLVEAGELCDPGVGSTTPCPTSDADCDDGSSRTTDALTGSGCQASCTHSPVTAAIGCTTGSMTGVCVAGACCTGCVQNGACVAGTRDATACGSGGNSCFDCTMSSASATCSGGNCSGCDATSCTTEGRTCGTSSCGFDCGSCADGCANGAVTHFSCVDKSCQASGSGNCGLYSACASSTACSASCVGDNGCIPTAWCGNGVCKTKSGLGAPCSAETTADHECAAPYVCSWANSGTSGVCTTTRCTGCSAGFTDGSCSSVIAYGMDPRSACQGYAATACHQNFCAGTIIGESEDGLTDLCDFGLNAIGVAREYGTGTYSCTGSGDGMRTGPGFCNQPRTCGGTTTDCSDNIGQRGCYPCNSTHTDCNASGRSQISC